MDILTPKQLNYMNIFTVNERNVLKLFIKIYFVGYETNCHT